MRYEDICPGHIVLLRDGKGSAYPDRITTYKVLCETGGGWLAKNIIAGWTRTFNSTHFVKVLNSKK